MSGPAPRPAIVLVAPLIPGNTGSVARTCAALAVDLCLVGPIPFDLSERAVRRAGLDYWPHVALHLYDDWPHFLARRAPREAALFPFEEFGPLSVYDVAWPADAHLVFGTETTGLGPEVLGRAPRARRAAADALRRTSGRSNLANAATAAAYVAFRALL